MELSVRGWRRDHGKRVIGDIVVSAETVDCADPSRTSYRASPKIHISDDSVDVTWSAELRLTGEYRIDITISKQEIDELFRFVHKEQITQKQLSEIGVVLESIEPSAELVRQTIREMPVGAFLRLIGSGEI